jgi:hypothetical protein
MSMRCRFFWLLGQWRWLRLKYNETAGEPISYSADFFFFSTTMRWLSCCGGGAATNIETQRYNGQQQQQPLPLLDVVETGTPSLGFPHKQPAADVLLDLVRAPFLVVVERLSCRGACILIFYWNWLFVPC